MKRVWTGELSRPVSKRRGPVGLQGDRGAVAPESALGPTSREVGRTAGALALGRPVGNPEPNPSIPAALAPQLSREGRESGLSVYRRVGFGGMASDGSIPARFEPQPAQPLLWSVFVVRRDGQIGNARTAKLTDGGRIGVRAPMGEEQPVVRPYVLVDDIQAAVKAAEAAGAEVLMPPTEIPSRGTFAICYLGKIEHGLWQTLEAGRPSLT